MGPVHPPRREVLLDGLALAKAWRRCAIPLRITARTSSTLIRERRLERQQELSKGDQHRDARHPLVHPHSQRDRVEVEKRYLEVRQGSLLPSRQLALERPDHPRDRALRERRRLEQRPQCAGDAPQDSYQYDVQGRPISISKLGSKVEDLSYDAAGSLVGRALGNGADSARYYIGDDLTVVVGSTGSSRTVGCAHARLGSKRIASIWAKRTSSASTNGVIYYHRDSRSSVVATTTAGGNTGVSYRYLPSGAVDTVVGTEADETASELGFIGGIKLSGGLVHLRARVYSPLGSGASSSQIRSTSAGIPMRREIRSTSLTRAVAYQRQAYRKL